MAQWVAAAGLDLKKVVDLPAGDAADRLTVTLWLAHDRRILLADGDSGREVA